MPTCTPRLATSAGIWKTRFVETAGANRISSPSTSTIARRGRLFPHADARPSMRNIWWSPHPRAGWKSERPMAHTAPASRICLVAFRSESKGARSPCQRIRRGIGLDSPGSLSVSPPWRSAASGCGPLPPGDRGLILDGRTVVGYLQEASPMPSNPVTRRGTTRRDVLTQALAASAAVAFPQVIPARALGRGGALAPGEKITLGVIGIGPRCTYDLKSMLALADVQLRGHLRRPGQPPRGRQGAGRPALRQHGLRHLSRLPRAARRARTSTPC